MRRPTRGLYYTAGNGQDVSPVCARAGSAAAAEPARLVAGVITWRISSATWSISLGPVGDHAGPTKTKIAATRRTTRSC